MVQKSVVGNNNEDLYPKSWEAVVIGRRLLGVAYQSSLLLYSESYLPAFTHNLAACLSNLLVGIPLTTGRRSSDLIISAEGLIYLYLLKLVSGGAGFQWRFKVNCLDDDAGFRFGRASFMVTHRH
jgi:hypothetical protein